MIISQKYEVLSQIGQGSMGVVYRVRHTALETISALKVLPQHFTQNPELVKRFYREARVLARMNHPNIVHVSDIHEDKELQFHYIVMEYIQQAEQARAQALRWTKRQEMPTAGRYGEHARHCSRLTAFMKAPTIRERRLATRKRRRFMRRGSRNRNTKRADLPSFIPGSR